MQYTKEQLIETIKKNRCTSITSLWKFVGNRASRIDGKQSKKLRAILGDSVSLFAEMANTSAETVVAAAEATVTAALNTLAVAEATVLAAPAAEVVAPVAEAPAPVVEAVVLAPITPAVETAMPVAEAVAPVAEAAVTSDVPAAEADISTPAEKSETNIRYHEGSLVGIIYREGTKGFKDKDAFVQTIAEMTGKAFDNVKYHFSVVACQRSNPQSPNNKGTKLIKDGDTFYIVGVNDSRPAIMEVKKAEKLKIKAEKEVRRQERNARIALVRAEKEAKRQTRAERKATKAAKAAVPA
jgi:hypothetical protein